MITRVCRRVSEGGWPLAVATDDRRIADCVEKAGFKAVMTGTDLPNGTHRVEQACRLAGVEAEVIINVQGDEPFIDPRQLEAIASLFCKPGVEIATLVKRFPSDAPYSRLEGLWVGQSRYHRGGEGPLFLAQCHPVYPRS